MNEEQIVNALLTGGPVLMAVAAVLWFLMPVRAALIDWIKSKAALLLTGVFALALAGCVTADPVTYNNVRTMRNNIHLFVDESALPENSKNQLKSHADKALKYETDKWSGTTPPPPEIPNG